jgi:hypothetical protein
MTRISVSLLAVKVVRVVEDLKTLFFFCAVHSRRFLTLCCLFVLYQKMHSLRLPAQSSARLVRTHTVASAARSLPPSEAVVKAVVPVTCPPKRLSAAFTTVRMHVTSVVCWRHMLALTDGANLTLVDVCLLFCILSSFVTAVVSERNRRGNMKNQYHALRECIPELAGNDRPSNRTILSKAVDCIMDLQKQDRDFELQLAQLREENRRLLSSRK